MHCSNGFLYTAALGTKHAAQRTARAAAVILPDDPKYYEDSPVNTLTDDGCQNSEDSLAAEFFTLMKLSRGSKNNQGNVTSCRGGPRVSAIRTAAILSMLPFGTTIDGVLLENPLSGGSVSWMVGAFGYGLGATAVNFPDSPKSVSLKEAGDTFVSGQDVIVRVTHLFHCQIPLAKDLICKSGLARLLEQVNNGGASPKDDVIALDELKKGVSNKMLLSAILISNERFFVLRKESMFPMQGAGYAYQ